jgi:hypothetical protein
LAKDSGHGAELAQRLQVIAQEMICPELSGQLIYG